MVDSLSLELRVKMAGAGGVKKTISAASARAHTRKANKTSSIWSSSWIFKRLLLVFFVGFFAWGYQAIQPPPPKICGSPGGPPVTATRIQLRDGRHIAYNEYGVPKEKANYRIVDIHGFGSCRHYSAIANTLSPEIVEELGVYIVSIDRPGYGESDPHPNRTLESLALDVEQLADQLDLGSKFYVIGFSMGGQAVWGCLKYIPDRLAGAALLAPVINYWWDGLSVTLSNEAFYKQLRPDQWTLRVAHYIPWLTYWWNTQKWFPSSSVIAQRPEIRSPSDTKLLPKLHDKKQYMAQIKQQGVYESVVRDLIVGFGKWKFSPIDLGDLFSENKGSFHLWHGDEDWLVPVSLQRYIVGQLPWIQYHEVPGAGHLFPCADGMSDSIIKALLLGEKK